MNIKKALLFIIIAALIASYFIFDLGQFFSLAYLKEQQGAFDALYADKPALVLGAFFAVYVAVTALSLPGAAIMTLAAGALFGFWIALLLVSFASSIGATLAFLASRFLFHDTVQERFGERLKKINQGIEKEGAFYLFTLRLVPAFPFFVINLVMGLTPIKTRTFYWVSQVGMLAGTAVYVNAGTQLGQLDSLSGLLSPQLLGAFVLLGIFPWIAKDIMARLQARKVYQGWKKPKQFDRNMVVIGAGAAGLVSSYIAATVKAKVTLIEKHRMGGDCLNTGCVPSKALIKSAHLAYQEKQADKYGFDSIKTDFRFSKLMSRVQQVIADIEPHDSVERYTGLGVECRQGEARIVSPWEVEIRNGDQVETLTTRSIIIASGARPFVPPIPGIEDMDILTSDNLWQIEEQPKRLLVLGGGPIGCELAQTFARLGSQVTQVEMLPRIMIREDEEASAIVTRSLEDSGVQVLTGHKAVRFVQENDEKVLYAEHDGKEIALPFDQVLVAVGRKANTDGLGLDALNLPTAPNGTIQTNDLLQSRYPNIYACGDVAGPYQFTHTAAHQAWYAAVNALFGFLKTFKVDYRVIPWCTFTDPEVARVGINEQEAIEQGIEHEVTRYGIDDLDRAIADSAAEGYVKVITAKGSDRILGVTIVGQHAGDLIAEYVLAMKHGIGLNKILGTIHIYPTMAEANKFAAGEWKKARKPEGLLRWVEKLHAWRR
ncbi:MAG: FAD-dependent oxidoreductase [Pseudomonadota bacterium]|uniref:FAD-dependent oxidoreductase n=1 Tax=Alcanivorax sp. TaxID=1872427 RepID=UPI0025B91BF4|nr:bifunctional TVP38/TMEM64 family protein/FAD-dependent oxidoreductase [Alcanivorax sp.]MED5238434.1 FAD-dependent oxidoreductase [Pseudomonadota bacterium]MEE3319605.1 FAD-dependent oxidoreductase [Pseudomonadota bacterium]